jgi:hypothetical protein
MKENLQKYISRKRNLPLCIGMERSGSTVAWQVASLSLGARLEKTHDYLHGEQDCIYTFRHPVEAYLSLADRFSDVYPEGISEAHALDRIYSHIDCFNNLISDSKNGRKVLFLRYEDFYNEPEKRLLAILKFLGINLSKERAQEIVNETSILKNMELASDRNFGKIDSVTQLHGRHINTKSMGRPGFMIKNYQKMGEVVSESRFHELCNVFGYKL